MLSCSSPLALCPRVAPCCPPTSQVGIAIVNDFKSIEGDRALGLQVSGNAGRATEQKESRSLVQAEDDASLDIVWPQALNAANLQLTRAPPGLV